MKGTVGILAAFLGTAAAFGQQSPVPTPAATPAPTPTPGPLQFQEVVTVESATRDQLYNAALAWFPEAFKSGKAVLQVQNKDAGQLIGTADEAYTSPFLAASSCINGWLRYRVMIEVKDGRYRYTIDGFEHEGGTPQCRSWNISFGPLTTDRQCPRKIKGTWPGHDQRIWADLKVEASTLADTLAKSLRAKLAKAATEKPW